MTTETPAARPTIQMVCVGKTLLQSGKIGFVFNEVLADGTLGTERIYSDRNLKHVRVGAVYQVEVDPENPRSIFTQTLRWVSLWHNKEEAAVWQLTTDAFDTASAALKQEKKETSRELLVELLAPLRKRYWSTNPVNRLAMEVRILAYLRRVPLRDESI